MWYVCCMCTPCACSCGGPRLRLGLSSACASTLSTEVKVFQSNTEINNMATLTSQPSVSLPSEAAWTGSLPYPYSICGFGRSKLWSFCLLGKWQVLHPWAICPVTYHLLFRSNSMLSCCSLPSSSGQNWYFPTYYLIAGISSAESLAICIFEIAHKRFLKKDAVLTKMPKILLWFKIELLGPERSQLCHSTGAHSEAVSPQIAVSVTNTRLSF